MIINCIHLKIILEYRNKATKPIKRQTTEILIMQQKGAGQQLSRATRGDNCYYAAKRFRIVLGVVSKLRLRVVYRSAFNKGSALIAG